MQIPGNRPTGYKKCLDDNRHVLPSLARVVVAQEHVITSHTRVRTFTPSKCARTRGIPIGGQYGAVFWPIRNASSNREVSARV